MRSSIVPRQRLPRPMLARRRHGAPQARPTSNTAERPPERLFRAVRKPSRPLARPALRELRAAMVTKRTLRAHSTTRRPCGPAPPREFSRMNPGHQRVREAGDRDTSAIRELGTGERIPKRSSIPTHAIHGSVRFRLPSGSRGCGGGRVTDAPCPLGRLAATRFGLWFAWKDIRMRMLLCRFD